MPLTPPRSTSPRVYEEWLHGTPTDDEYLSVAYDYLDETEPFYLAFLRDPKHRGLRRSDAARAAQLAEAWRDEGWARQTLLNFSKMPLDEKREMARRMSVGMLRRGGVPTRTERLWLYHGG